MLENLLELALKQQEASFQAHLEEKLLQRLETKTIDAVQALDFMEERSMHTFLGKAYYRIMLDIFEDSVPATATEIPHIQFPANLPPKHASRIMSGFCSILLASQRVSFRDPKLKSKDQGGYRNTSPEYLFMTSSPGDFGERLDLISTRAFTQITFNSLNPEQNQRNKQYFQTNLHKYFMDTPSLPI
jgi:hypothetical protein